MIWTPFKILSPGFLGIDIGTSSIKIVELSRQGDKKKLENYGEIKAQALYEKAFRTFEKSTLGISTRGVSRAITAILDEAKIKTRQAAFSIPDFSSFFTWFDLPPMTREEIPQGVRYEARQYIPVPLSEVTLDWQIIEGRISDTEKNSLKILLVAVPNEIIYQYQEIASLTGLGLRALEAEVFALSGALAKDNSDPKILVDIGAQSTTVSVVDRGVLKRSHSFDTAGNELTQLVSRSLGLDYAQAEKVKQECGLLTQEQLAPEDKSIRDALLPLVDLIVSEIDKIAQNFYQQEAREISKIIIAGGQALMPGLTDYASERLQKSVELANPFSDLFYPPILEASLKKMGPGYAIAVGMARRGLE